MSQWGVLKDEDGALHVAPVDPDRRLGLKHSLHEFCPCSPRGEEYNGVQIWIHQDPEAGGYNS
jgi:hypothetical protein